MKEEIIKYKGISIEYKIDIQVHKLKIIFNLKDKNLPNELNIKEIFKKISNQHKLLKVWEYEYYEYVGNNLELNYKLNLLLQYKNEFVNSIKELENTYNITLLTKCLKQSNKFYKNKLINLLKETLKENIINEEFLKKLIDIKRPKFKGCNNEGEGIYIEPVYHHYFKINNNYYYI